MLARSTVEYDEFRTFHDNVFDYAQGKGFLSDDNTDASIVREFMSYLAQYKMILKDHDIDFTELPKEYERTFLDWFLFEREIKEGKTIAELYIKSKKFNDDYDSEISEYIMSCVPNLGEPIWSIFTVTQKLDDQIFNVKELFTGILFQIRTNFTPGKVSVGVSFFGKICQFGDHRYLGSHVKLLSEVDVRKALGLNETITTLEDRFITFMTGKVNLSSKTQQMYEESLFILLEHISISSLMTIDQIKAINVKNLMKWTKEEYNLSAMRSKQTQIIITDLLDFL